MQSNLNTARLESAAAIAKEIRIWIGGKGHPEHYGSVKDVELARDFLHTLDLLETVLIRFEISAHLVRISLGQLADPTRVGTLGWEFWQIDVEEFFAANLLELCYQLSNAWERLQEFSDKETAFGILRAKYQKPSGTILARHHATHFVPKQFQSHRIAQQYSILRRPYQIKDGRLEKELAKYTMPRVAALIQGAVDDGYNYLIRFREATIG